LYSSQVKNKLLFLSSSPDCLWINFVNTHIKEFARIAKGLLVLPNVFKAGLFIGGEYGEGALRVKGLIVDVSLKGAKFNRLDKSKE